MKKNKAHKYPYNWTIKDTTFTKDKFKVFSCFACGGGSSLGYKLAGGDVVGMNEIDPKMGEAYIENHNPKYAYIEPIQEFKNRKDLPKELFELDILDGSPPCSSFSMSGNREEDWGKEKKFREGQTEQVLDTLFFDFIDLAERLQPKVAIAENVSGLLKGRARGYAKNILVAFDKAGYQVKEFLLNSFRMGVPQKRERVFFIAIRKDLAEKLPQNTSTLFNDFPLLDLVFFEDLIPFDQLYNKNEKGWTNLYPSLEKRKHLLKFGDSYFSMADELYRPEKYASGEVKKAFFNQNLIYKHKVLNTIVPKNENVIYGDFRFLSLNEIVAASSFPKDYKYNSEALFRYLMGMSVPPVMMAQIASRIYEQWIKNL